jgi:hypothetical protein
MDNQVSSFYNRSPNLVPIPYDHSRCWPIEKAQKGILTDAEARIALREEGYEGPVYFGVGEYIGVEDDGNTIIRGLN